MNKTSLTKASLNHGRRTAAFATTLIFSATLSACGSGGNDSGSDRANGPAPSSGVPSSTVAGITVSVDRQVTSVGGEGVTLAASGATQDISWSLEPGSPGRLDGNSGATVRYIPPPSGTVSGNVLINIVAVSGDANRKISIVLEGADISTPPGAPAPDSITPARLGITADSGRAVPGGSAVTLTAVSPASPEQVQWRLETGPGSLNTTSGESVVYQPPAVAGAREMPVTVVASSNGQNARFTILLQGEQGLALLAGNDFGAGMRDGAGAAARFADPVGVARDAQGNLYVADTGNHTIRRVAPDNSVSTIAGIAGMAGHVDGSGTAARLNAPQHIAIGADGNLYVTDAQAHTVRQVTPGGLVTTVAGMPGTRGDADGVGGAARFDHPAGIGADANGNLYVADTYNSLVRRITPARAVETYAGIRGQRSLNDGARLNASFIDPMALTLDPLGNLFVADGYFRPPEPNTIAGRSIIRHIAPDGSTRSLAGGLAPESADVDGTGAGARFFDIAGMAADNAGNLYVGSGRIRHVTPQGVVTTYLARTPDQLNVAGGMTVDASGTLYFADRGDHAVRALSPEGTVDTLAGTAPRTGSDDGTGAAALFYGPKGVTSDANGNLYVADMFNHTIRMITPGGMVSTHAGSAGNAGSNDGNAGVARFYYPQDVAADSDGNLYVADSFNHTIRRIAPNSNVSTLAGSPGAVGSADGTGSAARFGSPYGVAVAANGNVYVADRANHTIRRITPQGVVSTLAGMAGTYGHADGSGAVARFNAPSDLAIDSDGNLFVIDGSSMVRRITPQGEVTTLAGNPGRWGQVDGAGATARFHAPEGIAVGADGNLYVADTNNHAIRRITLQGAVSTVAGNGAPDQLAQGNLYQPARIAAVGDGVFAITAGNGVFRLTLP